MNDTIAAISTNNLGSGAINIIRMSGPSALNIILKIFSNKKIKNANSHTIHYGYIKEKNTIIDEVLIMYMKSPKTYTKEDVIEINCHGGYVTANKILELLILNGARLAQPGEFTKRAFLNGRINLLEAESVSDMLNSQTAIQSKLALQGITGHTSQLINKLREEMALLLANIEVNIDYPEYEDELIITKENISPKLTNINNEIKKIIQNAENGQLIKNGIKIAIVGKPNVGKSSLLNALLEEEKAIVTNISGTTRDTIEGNITYQGILLNFIDTAGIRKTKDVVEQIGVQKSIEMINKADITILVLDNNEPITPDEIKLLKNIEQKKGIIFINKIDLSTKIGQLSTNLPIIHGCAKNNTGINELKQTIIKNFELADLSNKDLTYLSNVRQISLAKLAQQKIEQVIKDNNQNIPVDLLAIDLKEAWELLGQITGEFYEDELIDKIFANFCLGK